MQIALVLSLGNLNDITISLPLLYEPSLPIFQLCSALMAQPKGEAVAVSFLGMY